MLLFVINSCKKDLRMAPQAPSAALLSKAKQFYAEKISIENEKNRKISSANSAKGKTKQIARFPPLWESASTSVNAAGQHILSVPLAKYLIDNKEIDYERSVVFEENNGAIVSGGITEVLGTPQSISENGLLLATGSINAKEINFTGYIINYDLNYKQTNGRQFKDGKQTAGEVTITQLPDNQLDKKGLNSIKTLGNKTTNRQNSSANPKNPISSFEPEIEGGQTCDNVYLAYIEKDEWGNITYIEIIRFLYPVCTGDPVGQQPPGGKDVYEDCAGEPNGTASDSACGCIGGNTGITECPPNEQQLKDQIKNKPFALFGDIDCETLKKWLAVAKFMPPQIVIDNLDHLTALATNQGFYILKKANIQKLDDAHSTIVNMDYFPITITQLPIVNGQRLSPGQFLKYIRININSFTGGTKQFNPYNANGLDERDKWASTNPLGAIIGIDLPADDGSVITSFSSADRWTFTTIHEPMYGDHPVSGNRDFGYIVNSNGSYTFYTRGVDRLTSWAGTTLQEFTNIPFNEADALWTTFQNSIDNFVKTNGGNSNISSTEIFRPQWDLVKEVMEGKKPLSTLSKNCPD